MYHPKEKNAKIDWGKHQTEVGGPGASYAEYGKSKRDVVERHKYRCRTTAVSKGSICRMDENPKIKKTLS